MAIIIKTEDPQQLLSAIESAIDTDKVKTWAYDSDGDFTHTAEQWSRRAWLRPKIREGRLILNIVPPRDQTVSRVVYGIFHGRFVEMLLCHFDTQFTEATATAMPTGADKVE